MDIKGLAISEPFIKLELKAIIARQIFHNEGFFKIINDKNNILKKAVEALKGNTYKNLRLTE